MSLPDLVPEDPACRARREVLDRVGGRWSLLAISALRDGPQRFNVLQRHLGVSQRMLTLTLRNLERDGLVLRHVTPGKVLRVDYALSPLGRTLLTPADALFDWADANRAEMDAARQAFDARASSDTAD
jgi:DNA-binding HxlR family transcriptional regulator